MSTLAQLRQKSSTSLDSLREKINSLNKYSDQDDRFWKPSRDKTGNGRAVIRFLPSQFEGREFIRYWDYGFQGPKGQWYIEKCLSSIGQPDPVMEENSKLWNTGIDENKEIARKRGRKLHYVSNILVIKDYENPENNGKVFLYSYGKKIFDKITDIMNPPFEDVTAINPFDIDNGANFKLVITTVDKFPNYDKSVFESPSKVANTDEEIEEILSKTYNIDELLDPKNFKSYDELKTRYVEVIGSSSESRRTSTRDIDDDDKIVEEYSAPKAESSISNAKQVSAEEDFDIDEFFKDMN